MTSTAKTSNAVAPSNVPHVALSFVVPVFRNETSLEALVSSLFALPNDGVSLPAPFEILLVDDGSDDRSWHVIEKLAAGNPLVRGYRLSRNYGQHLAVLKGLSISNSPVRVVLDADMQDRPEAVPALLAELDQQAVEVVFAGRTGTYQSAFRMFTSRLYRKCILGWFIGLPPGAGMFFAITSSGVSRLLDLRCPTQPMVVGLIAAAGLPCSSLPIPRNFRQHGKSAYSTFRRLKSALQMVQSARNCRSGDPHLRDTLESVA